MADTFPYSDFPPDRRHSWCRWQYWLPLIAIAIVVFLNSAKLEYANAPDGEIYGQLEGSSTIRRVTYLLLGGVGCLLVSARPLPFKVTPQSMVAVSVALLSYAFVSLFWSEDPGNTFKRTVLLACIVVAGFGIGRTWTLEEFARAICILSTTFLVVGIAAEVRFGTFLSGGTSYRFSGVFHPAKQAFNCGMLFLASLAIYLRQRNKLMLLLAAIACLFLVLTKARTGLGATVIASFVLLLPHLSRGWLVGLGLILMLTISGALIHFGGTTHRVDAIAIGAMGRDREHADPTKLTGRLTIWSQALEEFSQRPVLGYGYGAFWTRDRQTDFARRNGWSPAHSHSGYIESLVNLGSLGMIALLALTISVLWKSFRFRHSALARFVTAYVVFSLVASLTETAFVTDGYQLICLIAGSFLIAHEPKVHCLAINGSSLRSPVQHRMPLLPVQGHA